MLRSSDGFRLMDAVRLVLPKEHGSWSLALEPVTLGLLIAPSRAGIPLALAAAAGFFLRRPMKLLLPAKPEPRRALAASCTGTLLLLFGAGLWLAAELGGATQLWPLVPTALAGLLFIGFDARETNRAGAAEMAGATAFALLPAAFASLAGWRIECSLALAAVMLARSVPTVMLVRTFLRRRKGLSVKCWPAFLATMVASVILFWLAAFSLVPWLVAAFSVLFIVRAAWYSSENTSRLTARRLGYMELFLGVTMILIATVSWHL